MIHYYPHLSTNEAAGLQAPFSSPHISAGLQVPSGSEVSSPLFFGTTTTTPASFRASLPPAKPMRQPHAVSCATTFNTRTNLSAPPPPARSTITRGWGHGQGSKDFESHPPRSQPLPVGLSRRQICRRYPNYLHGDTLLRVVYGRGGEQGLWTGKDIWHACPENGRNHQ
jgi:hypothetical protein